MIINNYTNEYIDKLYMEIEDNSSRNILITGTTGVGKTLISKKLAEKIINARSQDNTKRVQLIQVHPSLSYEDFVGGITVQVDNSRINYKSISKVLIKFIKEAEISNEKFVLILYDIQRGSITSILGELMYGLEYREQEFSLKDKYIFNGVEIEKLKIPRNLYVIMTANLYEKTDFTIDYAFLRRFDIIREIPSDLAFINANEDVRELYNDVNYIIDQCANCESEEVKKSHYIGHGFFYDELNNIYNLKTKLRFQVIPLLRQYAKDGILIGSNEMIDELEEKLKMDILTERDYNKFADYDLIKVKSGHIKLNNSFEDSNIDLREFLEAELKENSLDIRYYVETLIDQIIKEKLISNREMFHNILRNKNIAYTKSAYTETYGYLLAKKDDEIKSATNGVSLYNGTSKYKVMGEEYKLITQLAHPKSSISENVSVRKSPISINTTLFKIIETYYKVYISNLKLLLRNKSFQNYENLIKLIDYVQYELSTFQYRAKQLNKKEISKRKELLEKLLEENKTEYSKCKNNVNDIELAIEKAKQELMFLERESSIPCFNKLMLLILNLKILWVKPNSEGIKMITVNTDENDICKEINNGNKDEIEVIGVYKMFDNNYMEIMEMLGVRQMILYGPPGTSKTYTAKEIISRNIEGLDLENDKWQDELEKFKFSENSNEKVQWDIVQFHPSYTYEDLVRGITVGTESVVVRDYIGNPVIENGEKVVENKLIYATVNKKLMLMANKARDNQDRRYFLIIDEINRANLATVLGELIYALEYRGEEVLTPYKVDNTESIQIPKNLYIIGTMNTADKSIGSIDYAIRRRFLFFPVLPNIEVIKHHVQKQFDIHKDKFPKDYDVDNDCRIKLFSVIENLFKMCLDKENYHIDDLQIGHTYFLVKDINDGMGNASNQFINYEKVEENLILKFKYQILPILREYYKDGVFNENILTGNQINSTLSKHVEKLMKLIKNEILEKDIEQEIKNLVHYKTEDITL